MKTPSPEYFTVVATLQKGFVNIFFKDNLTNEYGPTFPVGWFSFNLLSCAESCCIFPGSHGLVWKVPWGSAVRGLSLLPAPGRRGVLWACQEQLSQYSTWHSQAPADPSSLTESIQPHVRVHLMGGALDRCLHTFPPATEHEPNLSASLGLNSSTGKMMGKINASLSEKIKVLNS